MPREVHEERLRCGAALELALEVGREQLAGVPTADAGAVHRKIVAVPVQRAPRRGGALRPERMVVGLDRGLVVAVVVIVTARGRDEVDCVEAQVPAER